MYKISANLSESSQNSNIKHVFEWESSPQGLLLEGKAFDWDIRHIEGQRYHILYQNRSYNLEIVEENRAEKRLQIKINGMLLNLQAQDRFDLLLERLGMSQNDQQKVNHIKAPMPGLLLDIKVQEGQEVQKGDVLLILEAMKMENVIKAPADARVKHIKVQKGQSVEKNQLLIEFGH